MQNSVHKRRPRKVFSKRGRVPSFLPLQKNSRLFKFTRYITLGKYEMPFWGIIIFVGCIYLTKISISSFIDYSNDLAINKLKNANRIDYKAFNFLMDSGKRRLFSNNILGAYSEFNLAYDILPQNEELNTLLIETLCMLCAQNEMHCDKLDVYLEITD